MSELTNLGQSEALLAVVQKNIGGCREWLHKKHNYCFAPSEYVLWGKLLPPEALGPRCFEHARLHVDAMYGLRSRSNFALVNLHDLSKDIEATLVEQNND